MNARDATRIVRLWSASLAVRQANVHLYYRSDTPREDRERLRDASEAWGRDVLLRYGFKEPFRSIDEVIATVLDKRKESTNG